MTFCQKDSREETKPAKVDYLLDGHGRHQSKKDFKSMGKKRSHSSDEIRFMQRIKHEITKKALMNELEKL